MGKLSREKGKSGEREVVKLLEDHGFEARRGQQFRGGSDSPDVIHNMVNMGPSGFSLFLEVKRRERVNLYEALAQADEDKSWAETSIVLHRKDRKHWLVTLDANDFLDMMYCMKHPERI